MWSEVAAPGDEAWEPGLGPSLQCYERTKMHVEGNTLDPELGSH